MKLYKDKRLMEKIASELVFLQIYGWLCQQRQKYFLNSDVWDTLFHGGKIRPKLQTELIAGEYRLSPLEQLHKKEEVILFGHLWMP